MLDVKKIKEDFPILKRKVNGKPLVYLDNAATSQKPARVIEAIKDFYENHNANIHRGIHTLGDEATRMYKQARKTVAEFVGSEDENELVFVRNTTEAINLVAYTWGRQNIGKGEVILTTEMEHHSNIVPWQALAKEKGGRLEFVAVDENGEIVMEDLENKLSKKVKLVVLAQVSNFLGTINEVGIISRLVKKKSKALVLVDGAQAVPHMPVDVKELGVDFYMFSGHKMLGPMGIGCLWARRKILEEMPVFLMGGGMISEVAKSGSIYAELPDKFEGGTPNVAGAVGLAAAVEYLQKIGMRNVLEHERELVKYTIEKLKSQNLNVKVFGPKDLEKRGGLVAFEVEGVHAHDVAQVLDSVGVAVRSGHHCTMVMHNKLKIAATTRASFSVYNNKEDVDKLIEGLVKVKEVFKL